MTTLNYNSTASGNRCPNNNNPAEVVRFDNVQGSGWTSSLALFTPSFDSAKDFAYLPSVPADPSATVLGATNVNVAASSSIFTVDAVSYSANAAGSGIGGKAVPSLYVWNSQVSPGNLNRMTVQPQTPAWGGDLNLPGVYYAKVRGARRVPLPLERPPALTLARPFCRRPSTTCP